VRITFVIIIVVLGLLSNLLFIWNETRKKDASKADRELFIMDSISNELVILNRRVDSLRKSQGY